MCFLFVCRNSLTDLYKIFTILFWQICPKYYSKKTIDIHDINFIIYLSFQTGLLNKISIWNLIAFSLWGKYHKLHSKCRQQAIECRSRRWSRHPRSSSRYYGQRTHPPLHAKCFIIYRLYRLWMNARNVHYYLHSFIFIAEANRGEGAQSVQ